MIPRLPRRLRAASPLLCSLAGSFVIAGCGGGTSGSGPSPSGSVAVTITGVSPVRLGSTLQLSASVTNSPNQTVAWSVNGVVGGAAATGTISTSGLYTAPLVLPPLNHVNISAQSQGTAAATTSVTENILNPVPVLSAATATMASGATLLIDARGAGFVSGAQIQVAGASVTTTAVSPTDLQATIPAPAGAGTLAVDVFNPDPGAAASATLTVNLPAAPGTTTATAAARLLDQATFGPTLADIQHVQQVGLQGYLTEQFNTPGTLLPDISTPPPTVCTKSTKPCEESEWWSTMLAGKDQLRQRVAFAFSEMFVVSSDSVNPRAITPFQNMLAQDAFGNFSTLMHDVTLSPAMGAYLNMLNSNKPGDGQIANENFGREMMQLFTIGIDELNADGTLQLDGKNPVPNYTEAQVQAFARAWTGWTYAAAGGGSPSKFPNNTPNYDAAMAPVESAHDTNAKTLLNGTTLPAGQTAELDLKDALANLFAHPNVGPFVCRQLIQHLVASNPSPAYVGRVAAVFADDGTGVRGNLQAVVQAILLDPEARAGDTNAEFDGGHLREPMVYLTGALRGLGYVNTDPNGFYGTLSNYSNPLGERPYGSPSVFNFFPPEYVIPGSVNAPEFALENTASAILRLSLANTLVYNRISGFNVDLSATSTLGQMAGNPGTLMDALGMLFMHGQMPSAMRTAIVGQITPLTDPAQRVRVAAYLVLTSSEYKILH